MQICVLLLYYYIQEYMLGNFMNMNKYTTQRADTITQIKIISILKMDKPNNNKINSISNHAFI